MQNEGDLAGNDWAAFVSSPAIQRRVRRLGEIEGAAIELTEPGPAVRHGDATVLASDLDRARDLGLTAYRLSVEWSRIQPQPAGHTGPLTAADLDPAALAYYVRVLDDLEARGLTPVLSLNHLTLPLWVLSPPRESGIGGIVKLPFASGDDPDFKASLRGWENPETVTAFVEFVRFLAARWSERVRWWVTLNEPVGSMIGVGYLAGIWPPGFTGDGARGRDAYFNLIRAHCQAYAVLKAADPNAMVGIAHAMMHAKVTTAATDTLLGDQEAARNQFDYFYNWHILNAIIDGQVDLAIARRAPDRDLVPPDELGPWLGVDLGSPAAWRTHCDFIGLNYYRSVYVYADALVSGFIGYSGGRFKNDLREADQPHVLLNDLGWEISPGGFGDTLRSLHNCYGLPVLVTENGVPQSSDRQRGPFITAHLEELSRAVAEGVDVRGYLYWTLVDNWEWHEGYRPEARFGLFTVDRDDPAMPRHLTEGAHALTYAIGNGDLNGVKELFGTITSAGDRVRPPRQSTALYTGTLAGLPVKLWLRTAPQGRVHAVLHDGERALAGTGRIEPALGSITLQFAAASGLPGAVLTARNGGSRGLLGGSLDHDGKSLPFAAAKDTLVGQWTSSTALLPRLAIVARPDASAWSGLCCPTAGLANGSPLRHPDTLQHPARRQRLPGQRHTVAGSTHRPADADRDDRYMDCPPPSRPSRPLNASRCGLRTASTPPVRTADSRIRTPVHPRLASTPRAGPRCAAGRRLRRRSLLWRLAHDPPRIRFVFAVEDLDDLIDQAGDLGFIGVTWHARALRVGGRPVLPGDRLAHQHAHAAVQVLPYDRAGHPGEHDAVVHRPHEQELALLARRNVVLARVDGVRQLRILQSPGQQLDVALACREQSTVPPCLSALRLVPLLFAPSGGRPPHGAASRDACRGLPLPRLGGGRRGGPVPERGLLGQKPVTETAFECNSIGRGGRPAQPYIADGERGFLDRAVGGVGEGRPQHLFNDPLGRLPGRHTVHRSGGATPPTVLCRRRSTFRGVPRRTRRSVRAIRRPSPLPRA